MQTLRREVRIKIAEVLKQNGIDGDKIIDQLADAVLEVRAFQKLGDPMDGILHFAAQGQTAPEDAFIDELERGLRLNFKRNEDAYKIVRRLMKETVKPSDWLAWWKSDQFRIANQTHNLTLEKIGNIWRQAEPEKDEAPARPPLFVAPDDTGVQYAKLPKRNEVIK